MPLYRPEIDSEGKVHHKFIYRVYKDTEPQRRVYRDNELVYSWYDINYHYGQEEEGASGATIEENGPVSDVWGHTSTLKTANYVDEVEGSQDYTEWYSGIVNEDNIKYVDEGFVNTSDFLGPESDIDNRDDYDLYIDLVRSSPVGNKMIYSYSVQSSGATYEEAVELADSLAEEEGAQGVTGHKVSAI